MRIRKRSGPLGLPSISTTHLSHSDPPLSTRKHEEEEDNKRLKLHPCFGDQHQPSDQVHQTSRTSDLELTFIRGKNGWVCCGDDGDREKKQDEYLCMMNTNIPTSKMEEKELKGLKEEEEEEEEEEKMIRHGGFGRSTTTKNRKSNSLDGEEEVNNSGYGVPPPVLTSNISSDHHQVLPQERWCEGVKGFPLKKRRGSNCERRVLGTEEETRTTMEIKRKQKQIMNTANSNKKWVLHEKYNQELTEEESAKKVEGSRCSRINGRGWRCCQQTLVGYSLCEHHSGKGRLRSMNSIRNRSSTAHSTVTKPVSLERFEDEEEEDEEEEKTTTIRIEDKKRKKMGMVKARSIRSLLGQTQHDDYVKV